ncbi:MAG: NADH-quinone oxidoreductase subunit NuoK [Chloroflexi bacterium]|nr:NADH-quinone oxidoreductase subunit NuoK [Chloroflexota bacterium]
MTLERWLVLSAVLFTIGLYGALTKRHAVAVLMAIEIMFGAVNIAALAMSRYVVPFALRANAADVEGVASLVLTGQVFAVFIITIAAAEVALGLALVIAIYRSRETVDVTRVNLMKR